MKKLAALVIVAIVLALLLGLLAVRAGSDPAVAKYFSRSAAGSGPGTSAPPQSPYTLYIEPDAGRAPILDAINAANRSINLTIYNLNDKKTMAALENASARGVAVRVIYDGGKDPASNVTDRNLPRMLELQEYGIQTRPGPAIFPKTHQKTFTFDDTYSFVMTCNLKSDTFSDTRDFIVRTDNTTEVREIREVFDADWENRTASYHVPTLVWTPDHAKETIIALIAGAKSDITIYNENLQDPQVVENLSLAAQRGISVRVLIPSPLDDKKRLKAAEKLAKNGVSIRQGTLLYMHAKTLVADYGTPSATGFAGSQNFETQHLTEDRELGIIFRDPQLISGIQTTFDQDWNSRSEPIPFP